MTENELRSSVMFPQDEGEWHAMEDSPALHKLKVTWFFPPTELWLHNLRGREKTGEG